VPALTKRFIDSLKPTSKEQIFYDPALIGFGVRVRPNGKKVYLLRYRNAEGLHKKLILGYHGELTPTTARILAQKNLAEIHDGADPVTAKKERREAPTVADLGQRYLDFHAVKLKPASREAAARALRLYINPAIGKKKVADVQRSDIERLHHKIGQSKPVGATRILAMLSKAFNLAERWGFRPQGTNPCRFVDKYRETPRDRPVKSDELPRLLEAIENESDPYVRAALRLFLLTGLRKRELLHARWENVDLGRGTLRLPHTKNGRPRHVPLSPAAVEILRNLPRRIDSPFVFPCTTTPAKPRNDLYKAWRRVRTAAECPDLRIHDLRHSVATWLAESGFEGQAIQKALGHASLATTMKYIHANDGRARTALDSAAERLAGFGTTWNAPRGQAGATR